MPTSAQGPAGTVSSLHGRASIVPAHGGPARPLQVGDAILPGDRVITARGTQIQIVDEEGQVWSPKQLADAQQPTDEHSQRDIAAIKAAAHLGAGASIDDVITAIDAGDEETATAAGFGGGGAAGGGSISQGLRVDRVNESVSNQEFSYSTDDRALADAAQPLGVQASPTLATPVQSPVEPPAAPSAPVAVSDTVRTAEDRPVIIDVLANDTDADGDPLTVTAINGLPLSSTQSVTLPGQGTVSLNADGTLTFTPAPNFNGDVQFTYTLQDPSGASDIGQVQLIIDPLSDTPVAVNDVATTPEDTPVVIDVLANDTDADGDALSIAAINGQPISTTQAVLLSGQGTVSLDANGTLTFTPAADYHGNANFSYTVTDGLTAVNGSVTVNVTPVNDAPLAVNDRINTAEDTAIEVPVRANDRDADGDVLTVTAVGQPAHGSVTLNPVTGNPVYTPASNYAGPDSFTYTVSDPSGATSTATVTVTVGGVNDAPTAQADEAGVGQDGSLTVSALNGVIQSDASPAGRDSDLDGDTLTVVAVGHGATVGQVGQALAGVYGTLVLQADGSYSYVPDNAAKALSEGATARDVFSYTVRDGGGLSSSTVLSITVTGSNDAPVAVADRATTPEDTTVVLHVLDNDSDVDGDPLSITQINGQNVAVGTPVALTDPVSGASIAMVRLNADGTLTLDPAANYTGPVNFNYTLSDSTATSLGQVSVAVDSVNDGPVADNDNVAGLEDAPFTFDPRANDTDPEGDPLTITQINGQPISAGQPVALPQGVLSLNADGSLTFSPARDFNGPLSFQYTVNDGKGGTDTATVSMSVTPVNDPPVITDTPTNPSHPGVTYDPSTGNYAATTPEDTPVSGRVKATDIDGDVLSYTLGGTTPAHGNVVVNIDGTWTYTPAVDYNGSDQFNVLVSDGNGGTALSTVTIGVTPVNDPPVIISDPSDPDAGNYNVTTPEDTPVSGRVTATDVDGDVLSYTLGGTSPAHGNVVVNLDGTWTYSPAADYNGSDQFTVLVSDGQGGTALSTITIGVTPVNDPPVIISDPSDLNSGNYAVTTPEDTPVSGRVTATDADGDVLSYTLGGTSPAHGNVVVNLDGTWTYTPAADYNGSDKFTVLVSDGNGGTALSTITIGVTPLNDGPVARPDQLTLAEDTVVTFDPRTNDSDVDGDPLTITQINGQPIAVGQPVVLPEGTVSLNANGTLNFAPTLDYHGSLSLVYTVSDGHGGNADATVSLTVTPVDDVAVVVAGSVGLSEEGLANGLADSNGAVDTTNSTTASGQLTVTDMDGGPVSLSLSGPAGLSSGGVAITWSGSGTTTDPLIGSAGGHTVVTASIDDQGRYQVNLQAPVDHPDTTQEDVLGIAFTVNASNGLATSTSTLTVQLEDDAPASGPQVQYVGSATQDANVMLVIDRSGSMNNALSDNTVNGLKAALKGMLDHYGEIGDVRVQIVTFSDAAAGRSSWLTLSAAKTFIDTITANGSTNYDAALAAAQTAFQTPGKLVGAANVAYFLSDGQPTQGHEVDNAADRVNWEAFLQANHIDAYAVGINGATSAMLPDLNPVAYDGSTGTERPAVILSTTADVKTYLDNSVSIIEHGNVSNLAGADGLKAVTAFSAANQTASHFDAATNLLTLELSSGNRLVLNMATGEYTYTRHAGSLGDTFSYTVVDGDGDSGSGTLTLTRLNAAPEGTDATITLNEDSSHTFQLANFGFHDSDVGDRLTAVRIDTLPNDGKLLLNGQAVAAGQIILAQDVGSLVFRPDANDNGTGYAQFTFSVRDQAGVFDATPNTLTFDVTPVNDAPIAQVTNQGGTLLGLLDVSANPVLDLSRDQLVGVNDVDNNLTRLDISVRELLSVGGLANSLLALIGLGGDHSKLTLNTDFALTHGLTITGNDTRHITIESATPGGTIDVHQVNQLLSTLIYDPAELLGIQVDLLPTMTIHATDAFGATSSDSASAGLITVNVNTVQSLLGTDENDNLIGANADDTIDAGRGNDVVLGGAGHDHLSGGRGDDLVSGGDGNDFLFGNDGNDQLYGGAGTDTLNGGNGADYHHGGAGSDFMTGGFGSDVFAWSFADKGTPTPQGRPVDTITDFNIASRSSGGDVLDLRDLLSGENTLGGTGNLDQFLDFDTTSAPGSTVVHISSTGGFTNGTYTAGAEDQRVVLQNVDLRSDLGLSAASNDNQVIAELMTRGKLMVDSH